jgi:hypothetical protein
LLSTATIHLSTGHKWRNCANPHTASPVHTKIPRNDPAATLGNQQVIHNQAELSTSVFYQSTITPKPVPAWH